MTSPWHKFLFFLACGAGAFFLAGCAVKEKEDPEKILREMIRATSDKSFTGIKNYEQRLGDQFFRFRLKISHRSPDLTRLEFLEPAAKKGQVIVKRGGQSWKLGSDSQEPTHYKQYGSHRDMEIRNLDLLLKNYRLHYIGAQEIARHTSDIVQILSRWRPSVERRVWVDRVHRMPLQSQETSQTASGTFTKRFLYEQIDFVNDLSDSLFEVSMSSGARSMLPKPRKESISLEEASRIVPFQICLPQQLPRGFILEQISWIERKPSGFLHFHYSDGLKAVSLFEEDSESFHSPVLTSLESTSGAPEQIFRLKDGSTTIFHRHKNGTHATLVGEIEAGDLLKMISSL